MRDKSLNVLRDELDQLLILATRGDASATELERLNSLLREHDELRQHAVGVLRDEARGLRCHEETPDAAGQHRRG